jgi:asparagine synthase (glutamine-hydrolysing)
MSGIFGCWHLDDRALDLDTFRSCLGRISPADSGASSVWHGSSAALGTKTTARSQSQPRSGSGAPVCAFDGRLDNRDELLLTLGDRSLHSESDDCDFVRAAYEEVGEGFIGRLKGDFVCAIFDPAANRLVLARDRLGVRPLCFTEINGTFLFASEGKALLQWPGVSAALDDVMMADFLLQFVAQDSQTRTFFRDVQSLPPAHLLIVTPRGFTSRRYFDFDSERRIRLPTHADYVDAFRQLVVTSVRNRLRHSNSIAVSVSGGLDSSLIFSIATRLVRDGGCACPAVVGVNFAGAPGSPSDEEAFIRALELSCASPIERIGQHPGFMAFAANEVWQSESPLIEALASQRHAMFRRVRETGARRLLTGHWGDQMLFDADYLVDLWWSGRWRMLQRHVDGWRMSAARVAALVARDWASRHLPMSLTQAVRRVRRRHNKPWQSPWFTPRFNQVLRDRFEAGRLARVRGTSHAWAIFQQSRRSYHVQCMEWNSRVAAMHGIEMAFPYLDSDLVQFLMSIPGEVQSHDGVARGLMREAMRGLVPDAIIDRRTKGEFTQLANQSIDLDFASIADLLGPSSLAARFGYIDGPALWPVLATWQKSIQTARNAVLANRVLELCGIELLLRQFTAPDIVHRDRCISQKADVSDLTPALVGQASIERV